MKTLISILTGKATSAIKKAFDCLTLDQAQADIAPCLQEEFGHYQCNSSLKLAKILKKDPQTIAKEIISNFEQEDEDGQKMIFKIEVAGQGFINITLDPSFLSQQLNKMLLDSRLGVNLQKKRRIIVEFSSPNVAKELHVGHLRSTIIGDCIARLFEYLGHDVLRLNHIGNWGTQFGMLIAYLEMKFPQGVEGEEPDLAKLTEWYKNAKKLFDEDEKFKKKAQLEVVNLQRGEEKALALWRVICDISRVAFHEIYDLLDVKIVERGESFYQPYFEEMLEDLRARNFIQISDGAKCIFLEGFKNREGGPLPVIIQKSDGGFNYATTDLAAFRHRCQEEKADRIVVVTDAGQILHFKMLYQVAVLVGYLDPEKTRFDHVTFGVVLGPDGKKFKTREGDAERLIDLLKEATSHARRLLIERLPGIDNEELAHLSHVLGIDAIKYADLSCHRQKDYLFSYDRMLKFEGNTAPFLLYSYVRIKGIKRKTKADMKKILKESKIELQHPSEISLGLHLRRFPEILELFSRDLLPNRLADFLYELAEKFNAFFRDCRVEGSKEENPRLVLCELTARILEKGLHLLGLKTVNRM